MNANDSLVACFYVLSLERITLCTVSSLVLGECTANASWLLNYVKSFEICSSSFFYFVSSLLSSCLEVVLLSVNGQLEA